MNRGPLGVLAEGGGGGPLPGSPPQVSPTQRSLATSRTKLLWVRSSRILSDQPSVLRFRGDVAKDGPDRVCF